jgi:DNA-directed RNA polymerase subunit M/transcription elongation factor TFIIS
MPCETGAPDQADPPNRRRASHRRPTSPAPPAPTDPALVRRQATMPDAYGIRERPEPPVCGTCKGVVIVKVDIRGEHVGWVCKNCPRGPPYRRDRPAVPAAGLSGRFRQRVGVAVDFRPMNPSPPQPPEPSPDPCPECGSREMTAETVHENQAGEKHVHVVRLKCKRGHVWSPSEAKHGGG